jgi:hypothetical protein
VVFRVALFGTSLCRRLRTTFINRCQIPSDLCKLGERKRKLTAAVLSDHHGQKKGKKSKEGLEGEDIGAIGRILQKALQKRTREKQEADGVRVIESVIHVPVPAGGSLSSGRTSMSDMHSEDLSQPSMT